MKKGKQNAVIPVYAATQMTLILMQITGTISWPWWRVWLPTIAYVLLLVLMFALLGLAGYLKERMEK